MLAAGIGLILLGYAFLYSGSSNLMTGGKGIGFLEAITGQSATQEGRFSQSALSTSTSGIAGLLSTITPQGNAGASVPQSNSSPISGAEPV